MVWKGVEALYKFWMQAQERSLGTRALIEKIASYLVLRPYEKFYDLVLLVIISIFLPKIYFPLYSEFLKCG